MSIVSLSLDTKTRQVALTVDGNIVPAEEVSLYKYARYDGDGYDVGFSYTEKRDGANGLVETHSFRLPPEDTTTANVNAQGLVEDKPETVQHDIASFLGRGADMQRKMRQIQGVPDGKVPDGMMTPETRKKMDSGC